MNYINLLGFRDDYSNSFLKIDLHRGCEFHRADIRWWVYEEWRWNRTDHPLKPECVLILLLQPIGASMILCTVVLSCLNDCIDVLETVVFKRSIYICSTITCAHFIGTYVCSAFHNHSCALTVPNHKISFYCSLQRNIKQIVPFSHIKLSKPSKCMKKL